MTNEIPVEVLLSKGEIADVLSSGDCMEETRLYKNEASGNQVGTLDVFPLLKAQATKMIKDGWMTPEAGAEYCEIVINASLEQVKKAERERIFKALDTPGSHDSEAYHYVVIKQSDWQALKQGKEA